MSLLNDALRKKGSELKQLTGSVGTFGRKSVSVRSRKWRRVLGLFIAFPAVMAAGLALQFFFFRAAPPSMMSVEAPIATPEPVVTVDQTLKDPRATGPEGAARTVLDAGNSAPDSGLKAQGVPQRILQPPDLANVQGLPVEKENTSEKGVKASFPASPQPRKRVESLVDPADQFYQKAASYHRQNRLQAAIELYLAVLKENPGHTAARFNLAAAYIQTAAYSEAFPLLETLRARDPANPDILLNMAISKIGSGDLPQALMLLNAAEEKNAPAFELCFHRGVIFSRNQQLEESLRWYQRAEGINPHHDRLVFNIALTYDKLQQHEAALRYYLLFLNQAASALPGEKEAVADRVRVLKSYLGSLSANSFRRSRLRV